MGRVCQMDDETLGSLTKELPLASVDQAISLIADGMRYESFRSLAARRVHKDLPALLAHRFLLACWSITALSYVTDFFLLRKVRESALPVFAR